MQNISTINMEGEQNLVLATLSFFIPFGKFHSCIQILSHALTEDAIYAYIYIYMYTYCLDSNYTSMSYFKGLNQLSRNINLLSKNNSNFGTVEFMDKKKINNTINFLAKGLASFNYKSS